MAVKVLRYQHEGQIRWGIVDGRGVRPLATPFATTRELIETGLTELRELARSDQGAFPA